MGKTELTKSSIEADNRRRHPPKLFHPALREFFVQIPHKIQDGIKSHLTKLKKDRERKKFGSSIMMRSKVSPAQLEADLTNQMLAWKENPTWVDQPPEIKVSVPQGSLCNLSVKVDVGLPPDAIYKIVTDPDSRRVFKNIKEVISRKVLLDDGLRQVVDVEQAAIWKFLFCSGTIAVHVVVDQNRADHSMKFKQVNCELMKKFEGHWRVEPLFVDQHMCSARRPPLSLEEYTSCTGGKGRVGSTVRLDQLIQPSVIPPPPISWYLRGITTRTTEMLITDLRDEASRIRQDIGAVLKPYTEAKTVQEDDGFDEIDRICDIKERWAMRRSRRRALKLRNRRVVNELVNPF